MSEGYVTQSVNPLVNLNQTRLVQSIIHILTYVSIFVFALGAASYIADGSDVLLLEASFIVKDGDAVFLHHK